MFVAALVRVGNVCLHLGISYYYGFLFCPIFLSVLRMRKGCCVVLVLAG